MNYHELTQGIRQEIDICWHSLLPGKETEPRLIHEAMEYALDAGGKRIRPLLVVLTGELWGVPRSKLLPGGAALEMIHTFSLIHDDLPALDNDDLRRGRPTLHKVWDDATAILAGDALLNLAFEVLASKPESLPAERRLAAVQAVSQAVGTQGMIGGQVEDLLAEKNWPENPEAVLARIHARKTGALMAVSITLGGLYAGVGEPTLAKLQELGASLGLLFQITDDILDVEGTSEKLGKTAGKDDRAQKLTYPGLYGLEESKKRAKKLTAICRQGLRELPQAGGGLSELVEFVLARDH